MKVTEAPKADKKLHLDRLLEKGTVMMILDGRASGVIVPPEHQGNPKLALNLDYAFEIPDFKVLDDRVEVSLSFNRKNFFCVLPFPSIYIISSAVAVETVLFPEDVPQDLLASFATTFQSETPPPLSLIKDVPEKKVRKSHLKLVK